jgi:hypothetical protein
MVYRPVSGSFENQLVSDFSIPELNEGLLYSSRSHPLKQNNEVSYVRRKASNILCVWVRP